MKRKHQRSSSKELDTYRANSTGFRLLAEKAGYRTPPDARVVFADKGAWVQVWAFLPDPLVGEIEGEGGESRDPKGVDIFT